MPHTRILGIAGLTAWLMVGLPVIVQGANTRGLLLQWAVAYVLFGALFIADLKHPRLSLLAMAYVTLLGPVAGLVWASLAPKVSIAALRTGSGEAVQSLFLSPQLLRIHSRTT